MSEAETRDRLLVHRMAAGDERALAELYDRHGGMVYGLAWAILSDESEAEEASADAFLQAWNSAASFDAERAPAAAWLAMMVRTRALDRLRARRRREARIRRASADAGDERGPAVPVASLAAAADERVESDELRDRIRRELAALPDAQRKALELAFFAGLSHTEIAQRLGEPLGTVKTRIRSALLRLRASVQFIATDR